MDSSLDPNFTTSVPLTGWPLRETGDFLELGCTVDAVAPQLSELATKEIIGRPSAGWWNCNLADDSLTWTSGIYNLFGVSPRGKLSRAEVLSLYTEDSRAKLERLRAYSIRTGLGSPWMLRLRPLKGNYVG